MQYVMQCESKNRPKIHFQYFIQEIILEIQNRIQSNDIAGIPGGFCIGLFCFTGFFSADFSADFTGGFTGDLSLGSTTVFTGSILGDFFSSLSK